MESPKDWTGKYIILYGTGIETLFTLIAMINQYIKINYICPALDDDAFIGLKMINIMVISRAEALSLQKDSLIIVSAEDSNTVNKVFENVWVYDEFGLEQKIDIGPDLPSIKGEYFYHIAADASERQLIIYGTDITAETLYKKLLLIGIDIKYFITDKAIDDIGLLCNKKVQSVYDILYEDLDSIMVISTDRDLQASSALLKSVGLEEGLTFRYIQQYEYNYYRWYHWIDPQLGYNIVNRGSEKYPGFLVFGEENDLDYKIAIIGGSTADASLYPFKSWPEILFNKVKKRGFHVTFYVGGGWGHPVGTEVIKFLRDILPLEPDLLIDYSGVNNLVIDSKHPYCNVYQKQFYENISVKSKIRPVTYGVCHKKERFKHWLECERIMNAVCREMGIRFISVLQPLLGAKEGIHCKSEKEIILNTICNNPSEDYMKLGKGFSDMVKEYIYRYYWLYDFTHIFDEYKDIYIDKCHVNERGNGIIADQIYNLLELILKDIRKAD